MSNSPWVLVTDEPVPEDRSVMLYLAEDRLGSRFAISKVNKISNGYMRVIDGLFDFDFDGKVLAWRDMESLERELPLSLTGAEEQPVKKPRARLADQVGISFEQALALVRKHGGIVRPFEVDGEGNYVSHGVTSSDNLVVPIPGTEAWDNYKKRFFHDLLIEQDENEGKDQ